MTAASGTATTSSPAFSHLQDEEPDIVPDGPAECPGGAAALVDDLPAALRVCLDAPATS